METMFRWNCSITGAPVPIWALRATDDLQPTPWLHREAERNAGDVLNDLNGKNGSEKGFDRIE